MKKLTILLVLLALVIVTSTALAGSSDSKNFGAKMRGWNEVPPRNTPAVGQAIFNVSDDGTELKFKLVVDDISNVAAAHIHCAAAGVNGPVGVTLFVGAAGSGPFEGVLARGVKTAPDSGNACGWATIDDVVAAMLTGNTYVNVHTNDGVAPTNTGPGDFPGGEIRGQIEENGPTP